MQQYEFRVKPNASMWTDSRKFNFVCFGDAPCIIEQVEKIIRSLRSKSNPAQPQRMYIQGLSFKSVQFSCSVVYDSLRPHEAVHHQLPEFTQTHVHRVDDVIQPSHPLSSSSPPALNLCQHKGPFQWVSSSHQVAKVLEFQLQHQSFQWTPRTDLH